MIALLPLKQYKSSVAEGSGKFQFLSIVQFFYYNPPVLRPNMVLNAMRHVHRGLWTQNAASKV